MPFDDLQAAAFGVGAFYRSTERRRSAGRVAVHFGRSAEERVKRRYEKLGAVLLAERWRAGRESGGGEIDLIFRQGAAIVFVEVKARRTCAVAAHSISAAQWLRLEAAAVRFMIIRETGAADMRFDVALCGRDGNMEVIENARMM